MIVVPAVRPATTPAVLTVATDALLLPQVPPALVSERVMADPSQTTAGPVITPGRRLTVIEVDLRHPLVRV